MKKWFKRNRKQIFGILACVVFCVPLLTLVCSADEYAIDNWDLYELRSMQKPSLSVGAVCGQYTSLVYPDGSVSDPYFTADNSPIMQLSLFPVGRPEGDGKDTFLSTYPLWMPFKNGTDESYLDITATPHDDGGTNGFSGYRIDAVSSTLYEPVDRMALLAMFGGFYVGTNSSGDDTSINLSSYFTFPSTLSSTPNTYCNLTVSFREFGTLDLQQFTVSVPTNTSFSLYWELLKYLGVVQEGGSIPLTYENLFYIDYVVVEAGFYFEDDVNINDYSVSFIGLVSPSYPFDSDATTSINDPLSLDELIQADILAYYENNPPVIPPDEDDPDDETEPVYPDDGSEGLPEWVMRDYVGWIATGVSSFFSFELFPGFYLGGVLVIIVAFSLVMWWLKMFGGG